MSAARPGARPLVGYALVLGAATCFIVNAGVARAAMRSDAVDPETLTTIRVTGSVPILAGWALLRDRSALRPPRGRMVAWLALMGVVGVALLQWTYFVAVDRLPLGIALLIEYLAPVLVALWARFVSREPVSGRLWPALGLSLAGLALVTQVWSGLDLDGMGVLAALGAAVCFAAYFLIGEHGISDRDPLHVALWSFVAAAVFLNLLWSPRVDGPLTASTGLGGHLDHVTVPLWVLLAWVVVLGSVVPFALSLFALRHLPATVVVVVAMVEPVGVTALGWAWFGEDLGAVQLVGATGVVAGIVLAQTARRTAPAPDALPVL
ncbi:MAG: EamA family transporter [Acidimicrobiales bacterium]|nr:EamA family transporter [Acidimicrobiales bacterium]